MALIKQLGQKSILKNIIGHELVIERLLKITSENRVPNSLLFIGPPQVGKKTVALGVAQALLCDKSQGISCGECASCVKLEKQQSENLILVAAEKNQIKIEVARQIVSQLSLTNWGKARIVIIDDAHLMNPQAANALLKSIEEPPPNTHFILISSSQESVLKTIKSRSQIIRFGALSKSQMLRAREDAQTLVVDENLRDLWTHVCLRNTNEAVSLARDHIDSREMASQAAAYWLEQVRDMWMRETEHFTPLDKNVLAELSLKIIELDRDIKGNCDVQLTLENFIRESVNAIR